MPIRKSRTLAPFPDVFPTTRITVPRLEIFSITVFLILYTFLCLALPLQANEVSGLVLVVAVFVFSRRLWTYGLLVASFGLPILLFLGTYPRSSMLIRDSWQKWLLITLTAVVVLIVAFDAREQNEPKLRQERARLSMQDALATAVRHKQFRLHYQPIVDAQTGRIVSMEALLRWNDPIFGSVAPDVFLPIVEKIGSTVELEQWIIESACIEACKWPEAIHIHVNISPQHVTPPLLDTVKRCLRETGVSAHRLTLEIVETSLLVNAVATKGVMQELREIGVSLALDDFGAGFASLQYLLQFPINKIKLDRSFVRDLLTQSQNQIVVRYVLAMAREMKLEVTAEGVEREGQRMWLAKEGVDQMQGYLFGAAVSAYDALQLPELRTTEIKGDSQGQLLSFTRSA